MPIRDDIEQRSAAPTSSVAVHLPATLTAGRRVRGHLFTFTSDRDRGHRALPQEDTYSMLRNSRLRWLLGLLAALSLLAAACGDDSESASDDGGTTDDGGGESAVPACLDIPALYALTGPESTGFANWSDATELATTVGSAYAEELPDEPLTITGPGEESGTYDTYVEFVDRGHRRGAGPPRRGVGHPSRLHVVAQRQRDHRGHLRCRQLLRLGRLRLRRGERRRRPGDRGRRRGRHLCRSRASRPSRTAPTRCPARCSST